MTDRAARRLGYPASDDREKCDAERVHIVRESRAESVLEARIPITVEWSERLRAFEANHSCAYQEQEMLKRLWLDDQGAILSMEIILIATILVLGMIVGLTSLRDAVISEMADVGAAIAALDQSYIYGGAAGHHAVVYGTEFDDELDTCDDAHTQDPPNSRCVLLCQTDLICEVGSPDAGDFTN